MININRILNDKKLMNILNFIFFIVLIVVITIMAYIYMDYITPKLVVNGERLNFQKKTNDNILKINSPIETVIKKKIIPITVKKEEYIKINTLKKNSLEPEVPVDRYVSVPMYINMQEEEIKIERFKYIPKTKKEGYYLEVKAPSKEGLYTYNLNLNYRNTTYLFVLHINVI